MSRYIPFFTSIYESKVWGDNGRTEYSGSSGTGSKLEKNLDYYIPYMRSFIKEHGIQSVADLGCGDFLCGPTLYKDLGVAYTGYDAYEKVVVSNTKEYPDFRFKHLDFTRSLDAVEPADLCILKDVLQHLLLADIYAFLDALVASKKFKYILISNCSHQKQDDPELPSCFCRDLSADFFPLKKYGARVLLRYRTKELSLIA
jgi:hypothetical protein